ncbi:MAG: hypothetical protein AB7T22_07595 [Calditrichaceae bacterium]
MNIQLPDKLWRELEKYLGETSFTSIDDLVLFVLQDFIDQSGIKNENGYSDNESDEIKKRLEDLGYL